VRAKPIADPEESETDEERAARVQRMIAQRKKDYPSLFSGFK
jgi:hypothetical protein